jgi:DNA-binding winged helix-turn-helix (wHTH) protein/tetratricopeptide (TPR) repeat protein
MSLIRNDLHFVRFTLECSARQLRRGAEPIVIPPKAFDLLLFLALNPGRPLLKDEIMAAVWEGSIVEESNLTQNIFLLRKALAPDGTAIIKTLPGRGYQFSAQVTEAPASISAAPSAPLLEAIQTIVQTRVLYEEDTEERISFWRSPLSLAMAGLLVGLLAVAGWLGWQRWQDHVGGPPVQVVLTDLEGGTGDPVLDHTLNSVFRIELAQSPFVSVVSGSTVRQTLTQMMHKPTAPVTVELARDICERTASQAVLHGVVAHAGKNYVLTEDAINCTDGSSLGSAKEEVARPEDLPRSVEKLGSSIRHNLGESRRSIARFNKPLAPVSTGSLDALKNYSQASFLSQQGHFAEAIELLKQAVAIDPKFAAAYLDLANFSANALNPTGAHAWLLKAYEFRDNGTEPTRLFITARYQSEVTGDLYESLRNYQAWVDLYPRSPQPWSGLANVNHQLGNAQEELAAAKRLKELLPNNSAVYQEVATAQIGVGDFVAARAACDLAISRGYDAEAIRYLLLRLGHLTHDPALVAAQETWADAHPNSPILLVNLAVYAQDEGRMIDAEKYFDRAAEAFRREGAPEAITHIRQGMSEAYNEFGKPDLARKMLHLGPLDPNDFNALMTLADTGDPATAAKLLNQQLAAHPQSTLWNLRYAPLIRGDLDLIAHKPTQALADMETSRPFDGQSSDGYYLRGNAYLQANQLPQAEAEFRFLLAHPQIDPNAYQLPMSQLQLARVLARENNKGAAIEAYKSFLVLWAHADSGQPLLQQAKQELAVLGAAER